MRLQTKVIKGGQGNERPPEAALLQFWHSCASTRHKMHNQSEHWSSGKHVSIFLTETGFDSAEGDERLI